MRRLLLTTIPFAARIAIAFCLMIALAPANGYAFKMETHVWLAQEVLNDVLDDGHVTIVFRDANGNPDPREFAVDPALVAALRKYQNEYRMGAIGPDAFPDIIAGQMAAHPGVPGGWQSDQWLRWVFARAPRPALGPTSWLNPTGLINGPEAAFAFGYLVHAAGDIFAHTYINGYAGDIFDINDGEFEVEVRHLALEGFIEKHNPPFRNYSGATLGRAETLVNASSVSRFIRDTLILNASVADQYRKQDATTHLAALYDFWKTQGDIIAYVDAANAQVTAKITSLQDAINDLQDRIDGVKDELWWCPVNPFADCGSLVATILTLEGNLKLLETSLDAVKEVQQHMVDRVTTPLQTWRNDVAEAVRQYVLTSQDVSIAIMRADLPNLGEQDKVPAKLKAWLCRWAPVFALVPSQVTAIGCIPQQQLGQLQDDINAFRTELAEKLGPVDWFVDPSYKVDELIDEQLDKGLFTRLTEKMLGENSPIVSLVRLREQPENESDLAGVLNDEFARDSSSKHLISYGDMSVRAMLDMNALAGGPFDPESFGPVYDATVLSKLVLLGTNELNRMVVEAGVTNTIYGASLFVPNTYSNILFDAVRSLDGNHQWEEVALPYPRAIGSDPGWPSNRQFGYPFSGSFTGHKGFRLWQDCEVREQVFKRIFRGPIGPVPLWGTAANPFPMSAASTTPVKFSTDGTLLKVVCGRPWLPPLPRSNP